MAQKKRALAAPAEDQFHSHHPHYGAQPPSTPVLASIYIYTHKLKKQFIKAEGGSLQFGFTLLECWAVFQRGDVENCPAGNNCRTE